MGAYGLTAADIHPDYIPTDLYNELVDRNEDSDPDFTEATVLGNAGTILDSEMGGSLTDADNIALVKPQVARVYLWLLHFRVAQYHDSKVPEAVEMLYDKAIEWARKTGKALLAAETATPLPGEKAAVQYTFPDETHSMTQLGAL